MHSLIDLIEAVKPRQFFKREAPLRVDFDELRDKNIGNALTLKNAAYPLALYHQVVYVKLELPLSRTKAIGHAAPDTKIEVAYRGSSTAKRSA
jgi:hypothetical protein